MFNETLKANVKPEIKKMVLAIFKFCEKTLDTRKSTSIRYNNIIKHSLYFQHYVKTSICIKTGHGAKTVDTI